MWWRKSQTNRQQPSLFFDQWADNGEVKDADGNSRVLYHGTTHDFDTFQNKNSNPESYWGPGHYFTTSPEDASVNYAGAGPDLSSRIQLRAEQIADEIYHTISDNDDEELTREEYPQIFGVDGELDQRLVGSLSQEMATREMYGGKDHVKPVYLRMHNPLNIVGSEATYFDHHQAYDSENNEYGEESGLVVALYNAIVSAGNDFGFDGSAAWTNISDRLEPNEGIRADAVNKILRECDEIAYVQDDEGRLISPQVVADIFRRMGYDGTVMNAYHHFGKGRQYGQKMQGIFPDTRHYFAWDGNNVKSATGNNGIYDVNNPKITASVMPLSWYKVAQIIGGKISPEALINSVEKGPAEKILQQQRADPRVPNPEDLTLQEQLEGLRKQNLNNPNSPPNGNGQTSSEGTSMASIEGAQGETVEKGGGERFNSPKNHDLFHDNYPVDQSFAH